MKSRARFRLLTALLCLVMLLSVRLLCVPTGAAEITDSAYDQNFSTYTSLQGKLNTLINGYDARAEASGNSSRSHAVSTLILTKYAPQNSLIMAKDKRDGTALDLGAEFALLEAKAVLAAKITWIAYAHDVIPTDGQDDSSPADNLTYSWLTTYLSQIDAITRLDTITADYEKDLCAEMNRIVFTQKLQALPARYQIPEDDVREALRVAIEGLDTLTRTIRDGEDPSAFDEEYLLSGKGFLEFYDQAHTVVLLARHRLDAEAEYDALYTQFGLPEPDRSASKTAFSLSLKDASTTSQINALLLDAAKGLLNLALPDGGGQFVLAYRTALIDAFTAAVAQTADAATVTLCPFLDGSDATVSPYPFARYAACVIAKDRIFEETNDSILKPLIDSYVAPDGILELCQSQAELDLAVDRAERRKEWYRTYLHYEAQLRATVIPSTQKDPLLIALKNRYFETDTQLAQAPTPFNGKLLVAEGTAYMSDTLREAEARQFLHVYRDVWSNTTVTLDDRYLLNAAILDFAKLHADTQSKLQNEKQCLGEQYKQLALLDIQNGNGSTHYDTVDKVSALRQEMLDKLCLAVRELDAATLSPAALKATADSAVIRSDAMLSILEAYAAIQNAPNYPHYTNEDCAAIRADATAALGTLCDLSLPFDPDTDTRVSQVIDAMRHRAEVAEERLASLPTPLDKHKAQAVGQIDAAYQELMKNKTLYAEEALSKLSEIYHHALAEIHQLPADSDHETVLKITREKIALMQNVRRDRLYTQGHNSVLPHYHSDDDHLKKNGLWGMLFAPDHIPHYAVFTAMPFTLGNQNVTYREAVRQGMVLVHQGGMADATLLEQLRHSMLLSGIALSYTATAEGTYEITLLLPEDIRAEDVLGLAYLKDDGSVEFYNISASGNEISTDISHFSSFYIVVKKAVSMWPLILILSLFLLVELLAIGLLLARRVKRSKPLCLAAVLPLSPAAMLRPWEPQGAPAVLVTLGILITGSAAVLVWLIADDWKYRRSLRADTATDETITESTTDAAISPDSTLESESEAKAEPRPALLALPEPLPSVSADEADERISDEEAQELLKTQAVSLHHPIGKKVAVNIDELSAHFQSGETVSLESLKEKGLISKRATAIKVLARGTLDKSLTVVAHDFSVAAIKMILLTGGEAILIERVQQEETNAS